MPAHVRSLPQPVPGPRVRTPDPLWEDRPLATTRMDFRAYEAEMAAGRGEAPVPSPPDEPPGERIHAGWSSPWLANRVALQKKADLIRNTRTSPKGSKWR